MLFLQAQSYGPKACILMRVVETVTGDLHTEDQPPAIPAAAVASSHSVTAISSAAVSVNTSGTFVLTASTSMSAPLVSSVPSMVATNVQNANPPMVTVSSLLQASPLPTPAVASPVAANVPVQIARPATPQRGWYLREIG